jgi:hypothetical protein
VAGLSARPGSLSAPRRVSGWLGSRSPTRLTVASVGLVVLVFMVAGWSSLTGLGDSGAYDSAAFKDYAETLRQTGRLPTEADNYEYSLPPGYPLLGATLDRLVTRTSFDAGRPLEGLPSSARRGTWMLFCVFGLLTLTLVGRRRSPWWRGGLVATVLAALWAVPYVITYVHEQPWSAKVLLNLTLTGVLVVVAGLFAREAWPERVYAPALVAAATALLPVVLRVGLVFHPDPLFAVLGCVAVLLALHARRTGWQASQGLVVGSALGLAALVRQSAPVLIVAVGAIVLLLGRRRSGPFAVAAAAAVLLVAGPWWGYQTSRFGNPIQSNLDREGYMLDRQPFSFFVSLPLPDLVTRPYRESFSNELLPKFHAELWSDWFGVHHNWLDPSRSDRVLASSQSVLGFGGDALVLGGLLGFGIPALRRAGRNPNVGRDDAALAALTTLFVLGWVAYVATLVRFPQADGDSIKAHYLLFLAPASALFAVCSGRWAWLRSPALRIVLVAWLVLYLLSYGAVVATSFG